MNNRFDKEFTKFSLFKLATFLVFWFIYPIFLLVFYAIYHSFLISIKGIKVEFIFDDETIIKPIGVDQKTLYTILFFPFRLVFHMLLGFTLSPILYAIHLIPSLGILCELGNFLECDNFIDLKAFLINPFFGTQIPIIYFNQDSWIYDAKLTKRDATNKTPKRKVTLKGILIKCVLIVFAPIFSSTIMVAVFVVWFFRQFFIYAIVYSFIGLYTEGKYINSLSRSSEYWLENDERKLYTILLIIPRIIFRIISIPIQMVLALGMPPFGVLLLPLTFLSSIIKFINICLKAEDDSIGSNLFMGIKEEFFGWTSNEITGIKL